MSARDEFDCTPQQYHAGLDQLWEALGLKDVQDEDVFTLAARAIRDAKGCLGMPIERVAAYDRVVKVAGAFLHEYHKYADDDSQIAFVPPAGMTSELALAIGAVK